MDEEKIRQALILFPGSRRAANGVIVGDEEGSFYITDFGPRDEELTPEEDFLVPFCAKKEIIRLRSLKTSHDYLLRLRAITIADSSRLNRVMIERRKKFERGGRIWTLSGYYDTFNKYHRNYILKIPHKDRKALRSVPSGFVPLIEANAICLKSVLGEVVIVSEALKYFYYYMTICLHGTRYGILPEDCVNAGLIGLRVMVGSEAQDFDIDPRGILPKPVEAAIRQSVDAMVEFTYGHEYAHFLLGHLSSVAELRMADRNEDQIIYEHAFEYEADLHAIRVVTNRDYRSKLAVAAFNIFLYLYLIEFMAVEHSDVPNFAVSRTHPAPLDRLRNLRETLGNKDLPKRHELGMAIFEVRRMASIILERIKASSRSDVLTAYGSVYMHGLGGKERRDRIDY
ncbi:MULTISPECIES: M48 family metalloprotease [Mesorhizobium]|uniref:M48 family metalloprotease n=1 Tax=Mesorhizobium TaxID=68287 RepID=UPI000A5FA3C9|nr:MULTISPECIES: M48 family metalloprotease [Mesorhizobium]